MLVELVFSLKIRARQYGNLRRFISWDKLLIVKFRLDRKPTKK